MTTLTMKHSAMIGAKQASAALQLPYYWFSDRHMRRRYRIPHYCIGGLVRFRLDELRHWASKYSARSPVLTQDHLTRAAQ